MKKIRKLQAHAESAEAIGNEEEAQAFAQKVQELLTAYKLSQFDLKQTYQDEPINATWVTWGDCGLSVRKVRVAWTERLAAIIAQAYYCKLVVCGYRGYICMFIGTENDRKIAKFMFCFMARFIEGLSEKEYVKFFYKCKEEGDVTAARGFKASFMLGFISRLRERFEEEIRPRENAATTQAIVLVRKNALQRADEWAKKRMKLQNARGTSMRGGLYDDGYRKGRAAADSLNLKPHPIEHGATDRKALR